MKKVYEHKRCFCKNLDGTWSWSAPLWFTPAGLFADCVIHGRKPDFATQEEAAADMSKVFALFGIKV